jgi:hypothetical protein
VALVAICLIALLGGAYTLYARMTAHPEMAAARYFPPDVAAFAGIDLAGAGSSQHHVGMGDLASLLGQRTGFSEQTCLDWQKDVVPNVGRVVACCLRAARARQQSRPAASRICSSAQRNDGKLLQRALACPQGYAIASGPCSPFAVRHGAANGGAWWRAGCQRGPSPGRSPPRRSDRLTRAQLADLSSGPRERISWKTLR